MYTPTHTYIFGPQRDKVTGDWRKLYNAEPNDLYCSASVFQVKKWSRMRWGGEHVAHMGRGEVCTGLWWGNLRERDPDLGRRIIIRLIFRKWDRGVWTELIWLRMTGGGLL